MTLNRLALAALALVLTVASCKKDNDFVENKVPVADAGPSATVSTTDSAVVTGKGTDADGNVVAYLWSQVSGPVNANIVNPGSAATTIKFNTSGSYVFQLMVTDNKGATGVDTMTIVYNGPKTLVLQPNNNAGEYQLVNLLGNDASGIAGNSIDADAWTSGGGTYNLRGILKFDLSSIPASATVKSATLYLYSAINPATGNMVDANYGSANTALLQQITAPWTTSSINWFNPPAVNTGTQITVAQAPQGQLDLALDVKSHVATMVSNNANYGWMLRLQTENYYNSRIFVSSRNQAYPDKHPKLVVVYQ
ncbi:hypothetical protein A4D02_15460 [Niastella koreensis]|uniref:PKD domain containing protein n=2 Tax=Niastella koreensis TaxID=354356 RepID=G8TQY0_NIAKG|nr:DNRLRE domain-containing protein [Niastella koreensis]AEV97879.1 PKD domain containing protein [Niastella koreensis GR20-10]OQP40315.1 hypothetical protein A4D02_15460 [Niastella koreensis]